MTIDDLIAKLAQYPGDWEVVVKDEVGDYREWESVEDVVPGEWSKKDKGPFHDFKSRKDGYCNCNSVLVTFLENSPEMFASHVKDVCPLIVKISDIEEEANSISP